MLFGKMPVKQIQKGFADIGFGCLNCGLNHVILRLRVCLFLLGSVHKDVRKLTSSPCPQNVRTGSSPPPFVRVDTS